MYTKDKAVHLGNKLNHNETDFKYNKSQESTGFCVLKQKATRPHLLKVRNEGGEVKPSRNQRKILSTYMYIDTTF